MDILAVKGIIKVRQSADKEDYIYYHKENNGY